MNFDEAPTMRGYLSGQKFAGRYELRREVGRGGMGCVWEAWDSMLERRVALKLLPEMVAKDESAVEDLKRETRKSLQLHHPRIVRIYDWVSDERAGAGIAMEFVDGATLTTLRREKPNGVFEVEEIKGWVGHIVEALEYAHEKGQLVHRDLKPANVMVERESGEVNITDFGVSRSLMDSMSRVSAAVGDSAGTLAYMSPQQALGDRPRIEDDVYAVGATIYELLTGKPPFFRGNAYAQLRDVVAAPMQERREELEVAGGKSPKCGKRR